jgi:hypothetical protein
MLLAKSCCHCCSQAWLDCLAQHLCLPLLRLL